MKTIPQSTMDESLSSDKHLGGIESPHLDLSSPVEKRKGKKDTKKRQYVIVPNDKRI